MSAALRDSLSPSKLRVLLSGKAVGSLALTNDGRLAFQYDRTWLHNGYSISPFSLPLDDRVFVAKAEPLNGIFGVFNDSLPDGWGRLLVDRMLRQQGIDPFAISPLARLAIVGRSGMGALEYEPEASLTPSTIIDDLDQIAAECAAVLATDYSPDLDALFALGGSSGGARPKILTNIDGEEWIVKFPASHDPQDIGAQEHAIALAAAECGIRMSPVRLLPSKRCSGYFATKRFDRAHDASELGKSMDGEAGCIGAQRKIHMATVAALLETSHRIPNLDYDLLMRLTTRLTGDAEEIERMYRLMAFNVLIGNKDDHSNNFTFLHNPNRDAWSLSPAYDLTRNAGFNGEHATTVNGKGRDITREDVLEVGRRAGLSAGTCKRIYERIREVAHEALRSIDAEEGGY